MKLKKMSEHELYDFDLEGLDVEELEQRLEFAPWDPKPPEPDPQPYCVTHWDGRVVCSYQSSWPFG